MAEAPERAEDNERFDDVAEIREKLLEQYGPEELESPEWSQEREKVGDDHEANRTLPDTAVDR